ncbi:MAG: Uma2 family endonuclease [Isosphaeraceae bacterium]
MSTVLHEPASQVPTAVESTSPPACTPFGLSAEAFLRGVEQDLFPSDRRIFLWDGRLYEKMAKKIAHSVAGEKVRRALARVLPPGWSLWGENPILADEYTAPLPDLAVVRGELDDYSDRKAVPKSAEIGLVVELAESSLREDRTKTLSKYATAGLPVYWLVNLVDRRVEAYSRPRSAEGVGSYDEQRVFLPDDQVPLILDGVEVARVPVAEILPREDRA